MGWLICYCFLPDTRDSGLSKHHTRRIIYHYGRSIPTGISVQMVNAHGLVNLAFSRQAAFSNASIRLGSISAAPSRQQTAGRVSDKLCL